MGKFLDPTQASNSSQQPVLNGTLQFLQDAWNEAVAAILNAVSGGTTLGNFNIVYGCAQSGTLPILNFSAGAIYAVSPLFTNGFEIFPMPAVSNLNIRAGQVPVVVLVPAQYNPASPLAADPVTFTDATVHNVHNIRTMTIVSGPAGGSGVANYVCDYSQLVALSLGVPNEANLRDANDFNLAIQIENEVIRAKAAENAIGTGWQQAAPVLTGATLTGGNVSWIIIPPTANSGRTMIVTFGFTASTTGSINIFQLAIPAGATVGPLHQGNGFCDIVGIAPGSINAVAGNMYVSIQRCDTADLPSDATEYYGQITFQIA